MKTKIKIYTRDEKSTPQDIISLLTNKKPPMNMNLKNMLKVALVAWVICIAMGSLNRVEGEDIKWELEDQYEFHILKKRCIKNQIDRIKEDKYIVDWYCDSNINLDRFRTKKEEEVVQKTDEKVIEETIKLLHKFEWVRLKAYWDFKQYSICYGTKSYKWEVVTQEECDKRLKERVQTELLRINRLADNISWNKKVALISFFYNTWYKFDVLNYVAKWDDASVVYLIRQYNMAWGKYNKWLASRRMEEVLYYNTNK